MGRADVVEREDGRLPAALAANLELKLQDALGHPVRREVLRALHGGDERARSVAEIDAQLPFGPGQLGYHLQVLQRLGAVVSKPVSAPARRDAEFASGVCGDGRVRSVLRATERWDRERRETAAKASASPLLTMFRTPRPARTIRLRGSDGAQAADSE
jgi:DNA-binding transcriptional ArsR family regulator